MKIFVEIPNNERWNRTDLVSISMFVDTDLATWSELAGWDSSKISEDELAATKEINAEVENWTLELSSDTKYFWNRMQLFQVFHLLIFPMHKLHK